MIVLMEFRVYYLATVSLLLKQEFSIDFNESWIIIIVFFPIEFKKKSQNLAVSSWPIFRQNFCCKSAERFTRERVIGIVPSP